MRTVNLTYKDPNKRGEISKISIEAETKDKLSEKVTKEVEGLTKKGIFSINVREKKERIKELQIKKEEPVITQKDRYLKY